MIDRREASKREINDKIIRNIIRLVKYYFFINILITYLPKSGFVLTRQAKSLKRRPNNKR